jgi:nucleoside-diphosphate-sugar epimerase
LHALPCEQFFTHDSGWYYLKKKSEMTSSSPLKVLVFGGNQFVGRAVATEAVRRGHQVTVLNRGNKRPVEGTTSVIGDRTAPDGLKALDGLDFDTVIDTWQRDAAVVEAAVSTLRNRFQHFIYVSSISVYSSESEPNSLSEESPVWDPKTTKSKYSADKRGGELAAQASGVPVLVVRPGLILGPNEGVKGRLPWWLLRLQRGGPTLAPGPPDMTLQFIDARDLAIFLVDSAESRLTGTFNTLSQPGHSSMAELLDTCRDLTGGTAQLKWKCPQSILDASVKPWTELPIWLPPGKNHSFCYNVDVTKAVEQGLRVRPAVDTYTDTWEWLKGEDPSSSDVTGDLGDLGIDPDKEMSVLEESST